MDQSSPPPSNKDDLHDSGVTGPSHSVSAPNASNGRYDINKLIISVNSSQLKAPKNSRITWSALIDRGANGCIAGNDMKVISKTMRTIDLSGIDDHTVRNLTLVQAGAVVATDKGEIIFIVNQAADMTRDSRTILSAAQLEHFGCMVHEKAPQITKIHPYIDLPGGYKVPIAIRNGLPYIRLRPFGETDWNRLPHVVVTSPEQWNPSCLDAPVLPSWYKHTTPHASPVPPLLSPDGALLPDPNESDDEGSGTDRRHRAVDRKGIIVYLASLIPGELEEEDDDIDDTATLNIFSSEFFTASQAKTRRERTRGAKTHNRMFDLPELPDSRRRKDRRATATEDPITGSIPDDNAEAMATEDPTTGSIPDTDDTGTPEDDAIDPEATEDEDQVDSSDDEGESKVPTGKGYNNPAKSIEASDPIVIQPSKRNHAVYARYFPGTDLDTIKTTFKATTQYGTKGAVDGFTLRDRIVAPNPVLSIPRRHEDVATDTLYSNTPAVDDGSTAAQFFIGRKSHFRSAAPMGSTDKQFSFKLMDEIRKYGAMTRLISDGSKAQCSNRVKEILRTFYIKDWQSEPYKGNQNFAERGWRDTKTKVNNLLNSSGADSRAWLLALQYICFVQNHTAVKSLGNRTPTEWLLGYTPDITVLLQFEFWEPVYYAKYDGKFPSDSTELLGRYVGVSENVGHAMTYKILTADDKVISRGIVRSAVKEGAFINKRADEKAEDSTVSKSEPEAVSQEDKGEQVDSVEPPSREVITTGSDQDFVTKLKKDIVLSRRERAILKGRPLHNIDTTALLGRTFINDPGEDGEQKRAKINDIMPTGDWTADRTQRLYRFQATVGDKVYEKILTYNKMLEWCERDMIMDGHFEIDAILAHRKNPKAGFGYDVKIRWGDGTCQWNDLKLTFDDDPISVALYAQRNNLLNDPGWKKCKPYAKNKKKLARMVNQARLRSNRTRPVYKYGFQVPRNHEEAVRIDEKNGNTLWQDAEELEVDQLQEYSTFNDLGIGAPIPTGYTKIPVHFVYDVKHDGRHKARMVAGGHRTETPVDSVYSGVVSLTGIRTVTFLAEHNKLELWGTDIGNAYLESYTKEKVCFVAGPEFGALSGHVFVIRKALYGLRSSGARWHDRLFDTLTDMGFTPSKMDPDIWMRPKADHYEYIACYVDDLLIASKTPQAIIDSLQGKPNNFKLKGTGPISFHLGCDFFRDEDGVLCVGPRKYIERMVMQYESMFGTKPKGGYSSPLVSNDHPELDTTDLLDEDGIHQYQSLIGTLQWTISLGRFDIATAVMTMSGFRTAPRSGHLDRVKRICGYLSKMKHGFIRIRTDEPDYSDMQAADYDWTRSVYGNVTEELPKDAPEPLGKEVVLTSYVDANLYHDMVTGRSVTGVLHFINQTPVEWYSKKQPTVETATYGSEFVAAKTACQQIMGMRISLRYLGVKIRGATKLFGDNGSVVKNGSIPHSTLRKRHHGLSYHYTRETIASNAVDYQFIPGHLNPADILSKHWGYQQIWASTMRPILFWRGNTSDLLLDEAQPSKKSSAEMKEEVDGLPGKE